MGLSLRDQFPLRLIIGQEDCTFLLDQGASFSSVDPGGYEAASFQLPRDMPNSIRGSYVRLDCGLKTVWEGRISQPQRSLSHETTLTCEGYGAALKDLARSMVFVDRDMTRWAGPSVQRKINQASAARGVSDPSAVPDTTSGAPSLELLLAGPWTVLPQAEGYYDAGPANLIASLYYAWKINANISSTDANWNWSAALSSDDVLTAFDTSGNLRAAGPGSGTLSTAAANRRFAEVSLSYGAVSNSGNEFAVYFTALRVAGNHGLSLRGSEPAGLYPSDIAQWAAGQQPALALGVCPDMTGYVVPHYAQYVAVTLDQIVADMATAAGWHWGVWEALSLTGPQTPRFDFRPRARPGSFTGFCRRADCDECDIREDLASLYDTAIITYTDTAGVQGQATATITNPFLAQAGLSGRTVVMDAGTMNAQSAALYGQTVLTLLLQQARVAGSISVSGPIDSAAGPMPAWLLKPGIDRLRVADLPSSDAWGSTNDVPISRMETSISDAGITTQLDVGSGANLVETLQSRLAAATVIGGQGGA